MTRAARTFLASFAWLAAWLLAAGSGAAEERVAFPSLDGKTTLVGHLVRPEQPGPHEAVIMLHGCSGLGGDRGVFGLYRAWSRKLADEGYVVLMVDSAGPRGFGQTCTAGPARRTMWADRPKDAYGALTYLQAQAFVRADRIGLIGWSQGGGIVLLSIPERSSGRPEPAPRYDFRAAVAFYPGACSDRLQSRPFVADVAPQSWTTKIPLLVLQGDADNWTPAAPCRDFLEGAKARGAPVEFQLYPGAVHAFDSPGVTRRERPEYRMENGVVPVIGTDPAARADAFSRVPNFLKAYLRD